MALTKPTNAQLTDSVANFFASLGDDSSALGGADLLGTAFDDIISGGTTNIESTASDGIDRMEGLGGDDVYIIRDTGDVVIEVVGDGTDTVWASVTYTLPTEVENIAANGTSATTLTGNTLDNILDGAQATGANTLVGGTGNDDYYLGTGDKVKEAAGAGTDSVRSGALNFSIDLTNTTATGIGFDTATVAAIDNAFLLDAAGVANITGNTLNNNLTGNSATNIIIGGTGNDKLDTGAGGNDTLNGGDGNDTYVVRTSTVTYADSSGLDLVIGLVDNIDISVAGATGIEDVTLGNGAKNVTGNALANKLTVNGANNTVVANAGNDTITVNNDTGTNSLSGGAGNDIYIIGNATDTITGELATAGETDSVQFGGATGTFTMGLNVENITLTGTANIGAIGNASNNIMTGNSGNNTLAGGDGNDTLTSSDGDDTLDGGNGNDTLTGGAATLLNTLSGGAGNDTYIVVNATDTITGELATVGETDNVQFGGTVVNSTFTMGANVENITLTSAVAINATGNASTNIMNGNAANNTLSGLDGNDNLNGNAGNDTLNGGNGNDILTGGTGDDTMVGGANDDTYSVDSINDIVNEIGGTGVDTVNSTVSYSLNTAEAAGIEKLVLTGTAANGTGNALANTITGNTVNNVLLGLAGNDIINASTGNDTITGGTGKDTVITGTGSDTILFAAGVTDTVATANSIAGVDLYSDLQLAGGAADKIDLTVLVENVGMPIASGTINQATFVSHMNSLLTTVAQGFVQFSGGVDASVVTVAAGDLAGKSFLAVDLDSNDIFTATDFVIEITGSTFASISTATFV